jgi:hypothetical protein
MLSFGEAVRTIMADHRSGGPNQTRKTGLAIVTIRTASAAPSPLPGLETGAPSASTQDVAACIAIAALHQTGATLRLVDGDLLLRSDLPSLIEAGRDAGFDRIDVMTTALPLLRAGMASRLRSLGIHGILVPMFSADADGHDWLVARQGSHAATLRAIRAAKSAGLEVELVVPALRPTMHGLETLVARTIPLGVSGFQLVVPTRSACRQPALAPHAALAAPCVVRAARLALAARRSVEVIGLAACLQGEVAPALLRQQPQELRLDASNAAAAFASENGDNHCDVCQSCRWQAHCPGPAVSDTAAGALASYTARLDAPPKRSAAQTTNTGHANRS